MTAKFSCVRLWIGASTDLCALERCQPHGRHLKRAGEAHSAEVLSLDNGAMSGIGGSY